MGFIDKLKGMLGGHQQQANQGVDKAATVVDERTGGAHSAQVESAATEGTEELDKEI